MEKNRNAHRLSRCGTKILRIMKLTFLLMLISLTTVFANDSYSQSTRLTLSVKGLSLENFLAKIEEQSEFRFFYTGNIDVDRKVTGNFRNEKITEILEKVSKAAGIRYEVMGRQIVLSPAVAEKDYLISVQQQKTVSGKVTDSGGQPLPGVTVLVKGTTQGTVTNVDGEYNIPNVPENATLQFSFVGMRTQEVVVGSQSTINVSMVEDAIGIEEVVAIGYGIQKKENVIGSVTTIRTEELGAAPVSTVSTALAGRLPGAVIQQGSGAPGDNASILIRTNATLGTTSPLIVVDGIPGRDLNSISAQDIESITVLKDASAAIYGARAANGVILVNTNRGKAGEPSIRFDSYVGFQTPAILPKMADAPTYAQLIRETQIYRDVSEENMTYSLEDVEKYKSGQYPWTHPNSDYFDETLKNYSVSSNYNLSVRGGANKVNYYISLGVTSDNGLYKANSSEYDRYNLRSNIDIRLNEYFNIGLQLSGSKEDRMNPAVPTNTIWQNMVRGKPTEHAVFPNGLPGPPYSEGSVQSIRTSSFDSGFDDDKRYRSQNLVTATLKVPKVQGLELSGYFAYDMYFRNRKLFETPYTLYDIDRAAYYAAGNTGKEDGSAFLKGMKVPIAEPRLNDYSNEYRTTTFNLKADYTKSINNIHNIEAFIAFEGSDYKSQGISAFRRYFISKELPYLFAGGTDEMSNDSEVGIDSRLNYFGRLSYNYKETYLFQFSLRRDGSLRFAEESGRWGTFPSVLAGWRVPVDKINFLDYLKLRASWGQLGNDAVNPFQYLTSFGFNTGMVLGSNKVYQSGLMQTNTPNPYITWEVANVTNVGFESFLFNNKLQLDAEVFYQRRSDILVQRNASVPRFTGISLPDENFGIVDSRGLEMVVGYNDRVGDFAYSINVNFAFARNEIVEYDEPKRKEPWQIRTGHPIGAQLLYKNIGVFRDEEHVQSYPHVSGARPGDLIIEDYNNDGVIDDSDRILFDKTGTPEVTYGVPFSFNYKNFQLSGLVQGVSDTYRNVAHINMGQDGNYYAFYADGRWTPDNIDATKPRIFLRDQEYWRDAYRTDYSFQNRAFARMKNLQISYTLPQNVIDHIWIKKAKIYLSGQNLFFIYNGMKMGMDPELNNIYSYPLMRVYAVGIQIDL